MRERSWYDILGTSITCARTRTSGTCHLIRCTTCNAEQSTCTQGTNNAERIRDSSCCEIVGTAITCCVSVKIRVCCATQCTTRRLVMNIKNEATVKHQNHDLFNHMRLNPDHPKRLELRVWSQTPDGVFFIKHLEVRRLSLRLGRLSSLPSGRRICQDLPPRPDGGKGPEWCDRPRTMSCAPSSVRGGATCGAAAPSLPPCGGSVTFRHAAVR